VSGFKDWKVDKKQTYTKSEACKLYSRVFWILLPNAINIDPYNFELYLFKVCAFFLKQCISLYHFCVTVKLKIYQKRPNNIYSNLKPRQKNSAHQPYQLAPMLQRDTADQWQVVNMTWDETQVISYCFFTKHHLCQSHLQTCIVNISCKFLEQDLVQTCTSVWHNKLVRFKIEIK